MSKLLRLLVAVAVFGISTLSVHPASARRMIAQYGSAPFPSQAQCMGWNTGPSGELGVMFATGSANCSSFIIPPTWQMALSIDTSGSKNVALTIRQTVANQLQCTLLEITRSGAVAQNIAYDNFTVSPSYQTRTKTISIANNNSLAVLCAFNHAAADIGKARILAVEY